jgi:hypothetical protein
MKIFLYSAIVCCFFALNACTSEPQNITAPPIASPVQTELPAPFRFHKALEVKPGLTFDVVSWGRGAEMTGSFLILRSDSTRFKYKSTTDELEGKIIDSWNMDMDSDGNPEIFIQAQGRDKKEFLKMYVYEFNDAGSSQRLRFPDLSSSAKRNYHGKDSVYILDGKLRREFPLFEESDTSALNPTGKKVIEYALRGNSFIVDEIKEGE